MTVSNFCVDTEIKEDLNIPSNTNREDSLIQQLIPKANQIVENMLKPFADSLPFADASITKDLTNCGNAKVEQMWHRRKQHFDDAKAMGEEFKETMESIITRLKATPTLRTRPIAVAGSFASDSTLLKNIPGVTDAEGNTLSSL